MIRFGCVFTQTYVIAIDDIDTLNEFEVSLVRSWTAVADSYWDVSLLILGVDGSSDEGVFFEEMRRDGIESFLNLTNL